MLHIGYFGDGKWAQLALEKILSDASFAVEYIVLRYQAPDEELRHLSEKHGIPCFRVKDVNDKAFLSRISGFPVDINVSMSFDQILRKDIICLAPKGFINCHAGALPFYRGRNILNWAIINGEKEFGVTVHYVDEGIDTGDIILQRFAPIDEKDRYGDVLQKAQHLCAETLYEALVLLEKDQAKRIKQTSIHPVGFYCSGRALGDEYIDWNWSSERICNFVRGIAEPAPGARSFLDGKEYIIDAAEMIADAPDYIDKPGCIVGKDRSSITVKTGDNVIRLMRILDAGTREEISVRNWRIGKRFSSSVGFMGDYDMQDKAVIVIGAGDHAKVLLDTLLERGVKVVGLLEKTDVRGGQPFRHSHSGNG